MSRREAWVRMPKEPAAPWFHFGLYERAVGMQLLMHLDDSHEPVAGDLEATVTRILRCSIEDRNERRRVRQAVKNLQEAGLVFEHEGLVYVLYDARMWAKYRELGQRLAAERKAAAVPPAGAVQEDVSKRARRPANDNARVRAERVPTVFPPCSHEPASARNDSAQALGERERVKQSTTCSEREQPSAAPLGAQIVPLQRAKRTRRKGPLDHARDGLVVLFGECFEAKYPGRASLPKRQDLLTIAAKTFQRPDGTLDADRARRTMRAFLDDGWWTAQPSRPGHSFDAWAKHTERYETHADRDRAAVQGVNYAF